MIYTSETASIDISKNLHVVHPEIPSRAGRPDPPAHHRAARAGRAFGQRTAGNHPHGPVAHFNAPWVAARRRSPAIAARRETDVLQVARARRCRGARIHPTRRAWREGNG